MTQADLAVRTGLSAKHINQVIQGVVSLSADIAVILERVLDISSTTWMQLEALYQDARSRQSAAEKLTAYEGWTSRFDRRTLVDHGVIESDEAQPSVAEKLLRFFQIADPVAFDAVWLAPVVTFRRSQAHVIDAYSTAIWLRLAERKAEEELAEPFSIPKLRRLLPKLAELTTHPFRDGFRQAQQLFAGVGVRVVLVPEVDKTRICGATRWLTPSQPVIAVTTRHKLLDMIWFALAHEVGHLILHPRRVTFVHLDGKPGDDDSQEAEANDFAAALLLPRDADQDVRKLRSKIQLEELAQRYRVAPAIVAGRYGHITGDWMRFGKLRPSVSLAE